MRSRPSSVALRTDTAPCGDGDEDRRRFGVAIGPCLALVAPSGMGPDERRAWLEAAFAALRHLPIDVIERGASEALRKADHPSKIVPIITAAAEPEMDWRRRNAPVQSTTASALPAPGDERPTADEIDAICRKFSVGRYAKTTA